jgi:Ca2+-binding RTX toxin-like protein
MLESLESRRLFAYTFIGGVLDVSGTVANDAIHLGNGPGGTVMLNDNGAVAGPFAAGSVLLVVAHGGTGDDVIAATPGFGVPVSFFGEEGNDNLAGGEAGDLLSGGPGNDIIHGRYGNDLAYGDDGSDFVAGDAGNDELHGGIGNDTLFGGAGNDKLTGGLNNDFFVFNTAPNTSTNRDVITDFNHVADTFRLENAVFTKLGAGGVHALSPTFFRVGAAALDANDFIVYNQATGVLSYDVNANASGGAVAFALLTSRPVLAANDFAVI